MHKKQRVGDEQDLQFYGQAEAVLLELSKWPGFGVHLEVIVFSTLLSVYEHDLHLPAASQVKQSYGHAWQLRNLGSP